MKKLFLIAILPILLSACRVSPVVKTNYSGISGQSSPNLLYYYLPESLIEIKAEVDVAGTYEGDSLIDAKVIYRKYELTPKTIADTKDIMILEYNKNNKYNDNLGFTVNEKGLLSTTRVTTEDQTAAIIQDISNALKDLVTPKISENKKENTSIIIAKYLRNYTIKASDINTTGKLVFWAIQVENKINPKKGSLPIDDSFLVSTSEEDFKRFDLNTLQPDDKGNKMVNGILTRPIRNLNVVIKPINDAETDYSDYVQISDPSKLLVLPINRTAFTETINNLTITDGIVRTNDITRPSPVKGFVQIPINVAKAIVSIPAQIIQIKINNDSDKNKLQASETARLNAEIKYRQDLEKINAKLDSLNRKR